MRLKRLFLGVMLLVGITGAGAANAAPEDISASISLKVPGNDAKQYPLALQKMQDGMYSCRASETLPLDIIRQVVDKDGKQRITVTLKALENVYFNYGEQIKTGYKHSDCQFYMPGFWYRRNLRSPKEAPKPTTPPPTYKADFKPQQHKAEYKSFEDYFAHENNE